MEEQVNPYIDQLLHDAQTITESFERVSRASGEKFNLFSILGVETNEVTTHSRFIAELLNPLGSHGRGKVFLDKFLEAMGLTGFFGESLPKVFVEKGFNINENGQNITGRIDILIESLDGTKSILIENKIYAAEQDKQLERYLQFRPNGKLLFLTLFGEESYQDKDIKNRYSCKSYRSDIIKWLELCRKELADVPIIRESITIYINLVKKLTNQNINTEMNKALQNRILGNEDNTTLKAYIDLLNAEHLIRNSILEQRVYQSVNQIVKELELVSDFDKGFPYSKEIYSGVKFSNPLLMNNGIKIEFQFQASNQNKLIYGFTFAEGVTELSPVIANRFQKEFLTCLNSKDWACYRPFEEYENWQDRYMLLKINTPEFVEIFKGKIRALYAIGTKPL